MYIVIFTPLITLNGERVSVKEKIYSGFNLRFHATDEIITAANEGKLPNQIMFTFHPQRWNDNLLMWSKELILQNTKNMVKQIFFVKK